MSDFRPALSQDAAESQDDSSSEPVRMFGRQRQPKGSRLERVEGRVKPETAAWLRRLAGDSSIGIALDHLRNILSKP